MHAGLRCCFLFGSDFASGLENQPRLDVGANFDMGPAETVPLHSELH